MVILEAEYPDIYKTFGKDHFVVQEYGGCVTATSLGMHLEQTIQRSKTKQNNFITGLDLIRHGPLAISNCFIELTDPRKTTKMFGSRNLFEVSKQFNEAVEKVTFYFYKWEADHRYLAHFHHSAVNFARCL